MATQPTHPSRVAQPATAATPATTEPAHGLRERLRARRAARKRARLTSAHSCRVLAKWLRRTAYLAVDRDPIRRRHDVLLHYRAAAVRTDLLEIAAMVEHAHNPDAARVAALHDLLANGCDSPLYNKHIHISELHATLDYIRSGL